MHETRVDAQTMVSQSGLVLNSFYYVFFCNARLSNSIHKSELNEDISSHAWISSLRFAEFESKMRT